MFAAILLLFLFNGLLPPPSSSSGGGGSRLLSFALVVVGHFVRRRILESPEFEQIREERSVLRLPIAVIVKSYTRPLILGTLFSTASPAIGLLIDVYGVSIGHHSDWPRPRRSEFWWQSGFPRPSPKKVGRTRMSIVGFCLMIVWAIPFVLLFQTGLILPMLVGFGAAVGVVNGPQAVVLADLFPVRARYTGVSVAFQLAAILRGAVAPLALVALLGATHQLLFLGVWALALAVVSMISFVLLPATENDGLALDHLQHLRPRSGERDAGRERPAHVAAPAGSSPWRGPATTAGMGQARCGQGVGLWVSGR